MLIDELVSFCDEEYQNSECFPCSAKVMCERECGYNCKDCLDDIHFHHHTYRDEYNCERLLDYYICRYSYKYCYEIIEKKFSQQNKVLGNIEKFAENQGLQTFFFKEKVS